MRLFHSISPFIQRDGFRVKAAGNLSFLIIAHCDHSVDHLLDAGDVGGCHIILRIQLILPDCFLALFMNRDHNPTQLVFDFFKLPGQTHAVLAHFQRGSRDTAGVGRLARGEQDSLLTIQSDRFVIIRHIRALSDELAARID